MRLSGGRLASIIFMLFGVAVAFFMTFTGFKSSLLKKMIGKGLEEYDAVVSRVFEVERDKVYEEDTDGYSRLVTVYDCEVELQYEIDGITYFSKYTFDDMSNPVTEGKKYAGCCTSGCSGKTCRVSRDASEAYEYKRGKQTD